MFIRKVLKAKSKSRYKNEGKAAPLSIVSLEELEKTFLKRIKSPMRCSLHATGACAHLPAVVYRRSSCSSKFSPSKITKRHTSLPCSSRTYDEDFSGNPNSNDEGQFRPKLKIKKRPHKEGKRGKHRVQAESSSEQIYASATSKAQPTMSPKTSCLETLIKKIEKRSLVKKPASVSCDNLCASDCLLFSDRKLISRSTLTPRALLPDNVTASCKSSPIYANKAPQVSTGVDPCESLQRMSRCGSYLHRQNSSCPNSPRQSLICLKINRSRSSDRSEVKETNKEQPTSMASMVKDFMSKITSYARGTDSNTEECAANSGKRSMFSKVVRRCVHFQPSGSKDMEEIYFNQDLNRADASVECDICKSEEISKNIMPCLISCDTQTIPEFSKNKESCESNILADKCSSAQAQYYHNKLLSTFQILQNKEETIRVQTRSLAEAEQRIAALTARLDRLDRLAHRDTAHELKGQRSSPFNESKCKASTQTLTAFDPKADFIGYMAKSSNDRLQSQDQEDCYCNLRDENNRLKQKSLSLESYQDLPDSLKVCCFANYFFRYVFFSVSPLMMQEKVEQYKTQVYNLRTALDQKENALECCRKKSDSSDQELQNLMRQCEELQKINEEQQCAIKCLTEELCRSKELLEEKDNLLSESVQRIGQVEGRAASLEQELEKADQIIKNNCRVRSEVSYLSEQVSLWRRQLSQSEARVRAVESELTRAHDHCKRVDHCYREKVSAALLLEEQLSAAQARGAALCAEARRVVGQVRRWVTHMRATQREQQQKIEEQDALIEDLRHVLCGMSPYGSPNKSPCGSPDNSSSSSHERSPCGSKDKTPCGSHERSTFVSISSPSRTPKKSPSRSVNEPLGHNLPSRVDCNTSTCSLFIPKRDVSSKKKPDKTSSKRSLKNLLKKKTSKAKSDLDSPVHTQRDDWQPDDDDAEAKIDGLIQSMPTLFSDDSRCCNCLKSYSKCMCPNSKILAKNSKIRAKKSRSKSKMPWKKSQAEKVHVSHVVVKTGRSVAVQEPTRVEASVSPLPSRVLGPARAPRLRPDRSPTPANNVTIQPRQRSPMSIEELFVPLGRQHRQLSNLGAAELPPPDTSRSAPLVRRGR